MSATCGILRSTPTSGGWILRWLPVAVRLVLMLGVGGTLVAFAVRPDMRRWRTVLSTRVVGLAAIVAMANSITYYRLWEAGVIHARLAVPLSLVIAAVLIVFMVSMVRPPPPSPRGLAVAVAIGTTFVFLVGLPLLQMAFFGTTDYRRSADVIVVFGARVDPGPTASIALADRVSTASELYREGLARTIIMSGGVEPSRY